MSTSKSLPARPSLESLRKQAKKLARDIAAGDAAAIARARVHLPKVELPLTQRNAQLVIAREYGFAGWQDLIAEGSKRLGQGLEWAVAQARRVIHDNDVEGLKQLLTEYPALLSWRKHEDDGDDGGDRGLLGIATISFGDSFDPAREQHYTHAACAELLIDAGAIVMPSVCDGLVESRARGLLQLFQRKGLLPRTLKFLAALGDLDGVRAALDRHGPEREHDRGTINEAFVCACDFEHEAVASFLLDRLIARDPELGAHIDGRAGGRPAFAKDYIATRPLGLARATALGPLTAYVIEQILRAAQDGDLTTLVGGLQRESWLLGDDWVWFQVDIIGRATLNDRGPCITALLDRDPALVRCQPPPPSQAIEFALTYAHPHLIPLLTRIWPLPDDLPHAAGTGNLARVRQWFDASGAPALGDLDRHYPYHDTRARDHLRWHPPTVQQILDVAFAFAVVNRHFDVADFLLAHGADVNTNWSSHEPASILHELVFHANYESMQFLIDRGIDMTIQDYRWHATAEGWARYAAKDEKMAQWLADEKHRRAHGSPSS